MMANVISVVSDRCFATNSIRVKCRGRLVEHDNVGVVEKDAGEAEARFSPPESVWFPRRRLVDAVDQMIKPDMPERVLDFFTVRLSAASG
jgi:hypothetical protein